MQRLSKDDYKLFKTLASLTQEGLRRTMVNYLGKKYTDVIATKDFIYAPGAIPIALVAHLDTVFAKPPTNIYYDKEQGIMWSPQGLGADDRAGVFAIIKILQSKFRPTIIFTTDEEKGCLGAEQLVKAYPEPPSEIKYIIQLDRRGTVDCVFYDCDNEEFVEYVENFGFIEAIGSLSDISVLCPEWGMAGVNLSIGYENEHSELETLNTFALLNTIEKVKNMLSVEEVPYFKYIPSPYSWYGRYYRNYSKYGLWDNGYYTCHKCKKELAEYEAIPAVNDWGEEVCFCGDCCVDNVDWCDECQTGYVVSTEEKKKMLIKGEKRARLCPSCKAKHEITGGKKD